RQHVRSPAVGERRAFGRRTPRDHATTRGRGRPRSRTGTSVLRGLRPGLLSPIVLVLLRAEDVGDPAPDHVGAAGNTGGDSDGALNDEAPGARIDIRKDVMHCSSYWRGTVLPDGDWSPVRDAGSRLVSAAFSLS